MDVSASTEDDEKYTGTLPVTGTGALPVPAPDEGPGERPEWLAARRAELTVPGKYLVYEESGRPVVMALSGEWTRIGRSLSAEIRFDDATVSRRHALVVNQPGGVRVLDDRSLNGVFVNGRRVEWSPLQDGDEITVGRHTIHYMDTATVGSDAAPATAALTD